MQLIQRALNLLAVFQVAPMVVPFWHIRDALMTVHTVAFKVHLVVGENEAATAENAFLERPRPYRPF
jgi:cell division protein FtsB